MRMRMQKRVAAVLEGNRTRRDDSWNTAELICRELRLNQLVEAARKAVSGKGTDELEAELALLEDVGHA